MVIYFLCSPINPDLAEHLRDLSSGGVNNPNSYFGNFRDVNAQHVFVSVAENGMLLGF